MAALTDMKPGDLVMLHHDIEAVQMYGSSKPTELSWQDMFKLEHNVVCCITRTHLRLLIQVVLPNGRMGWQERHWFQKIV